MLSFLYVYSDHSILECYNLFSGAQLSMRSFFVIIIIKDIKIQVLHSVCLCFKLFLKKYGKWPTAVTPSIKLSSWNSLQRQLIDENVRVLFNLNQVWGSYRNQPLLL